MNRRQKILLHVNQNGLGLEIGPAFSPIAPKREGFKVESLDHLDQDELKKKYTGHPGVNIELIEPVDHVWKGERFADLVGPQKRFDWIIASHVIEHTPCLITFLADCEAILNPGGVLSLAVPDKRYCFDYLRERSGLASVINAFEQERTVHTKGTAAECCLNVVARDGAIAWGPQDGPPRDGSLQFMHSAAEARERMQRASAGEYLDFHNWVFTPHSFRLLIFDLGQFEYTGFREVGWFPSEGCEFLIALAPGAAGPSEDRRTLLMAAHAER